MSQKQYFTTDERTVNYLKRIQLPFKFYAKIKIVDLCPDWKLNNAGREVPIDEDAVCEYADLMEHGSPAPAIIVIFTEKGVEILEGVQRILALELVGGTDFAAYVVPRDTSLPNQRLIRVTANAGIHGDHAPARGFTLAQSVAILYFEHNVPIEQIALASLKRPIEIEKEILYQTQVRLIKDAGYSGFLTNRQTSKWLVTEIAKNSDPNDWVIAPVPCCAFLHLLDDCRFANGQSTRVVKTMFDIDRSVGANRYVQLTENLEKVRELPEVSQKLQKPRKSQLDKLLPEVKSVKSILQKACDDGDIIHSVSFANELAGYLGEIRNLCKRITPKDMQCVLNSRVNIYDAG